MIEFDLRFVGTVSDAELKRLLKKENKEELNHRMEEFKRGEKIDYCRYCGAQLDHRDFYCAKCGKPF